MSEKLLNVDQFAERLGMNRRTLLNRRHEDSFPKPVRLGKDSDGLRWAESEVEAWIQAKLAARP